MSSEFGPWLVEGFTHVWSSAGLHHILFVALLTGVFDRRYWRGVVVLMTGFTVAHAVVVTAVAVDRLPSVGSWSEVALWGLVVAAIATNVFDRSRLRRAGAMSAGPGATAPVGALRATVREGPKSAAHFVWDGPLEDGGLRGWRYLMAVAFGLVHGFAAVEAAGSSITRVDAGVARVGAFGLGIQVGQWAVAAVAVLAMGWIAGRDRA